jgi:sugar phosphate isomerase/epimerase
MGKIGVQVISALITQKEDDVLTVTEKLARMGYEGIEFIDYRWSKWISLSEMVSAKDIRRTIDSFNIPCSGIHLQWNTLTNELDKALDYSLEIGAPYIVLTRLPFDRRFDNALPKACEIIYKIAEKCKNSGIKLVFHHHDWSVIEHDGKCSLDTMFSLVPAELLSLQVEVYWLENCGMDPVKFLHKYQDRIVSIHLVDKLNKGEMRHTELGRGIMNIKGILDTSEYIGIDWYNVEQEKVKGDIYASLEYDLEYLRKYLRRS